MSSNTTSKGHTASCQGKPALPAPHPLSALRADEMTVVSRAVKAHNAGKTCLFRRVLLREPVKALVVPYLKAELDGSPLPPAPPRIGQALFYFQGEQTFMETIVDIRTQRVIVQRALPKGVHGPGDDDEVMAVAAASLKDELVLKELARLNLPPGSEVIGDSWPYGTDTTPVTDRYYQIWFFLNANPQHPSSNFWGHPLDFSAVVNVSDMKVVRIDRLPTKTDFEADSSDDVAYLPNLDCEYAPDLIPGGVRKDMKPLYISQPEGVSFNIAPDGETFTWQKWKFIVNFDVREGIILRNVTYDNRPLFYRMSLSEMSVPYADPRNPLHRKQVFDLGECGAGTTANSLELGCDCLGVIHYMDGLRCNAAGEPVIMPSTICVHEQDAGLGWKHLNVRTGKADVTRARELVFQLIVTVGNYEYALYWIFDTAANIHYEIRATGIMSVTPADMNSDVKTLKYGTVVAEGVFAPHHQHLFNLRIDPAIDGYDNSVVAYDDVLPMPMDETNPHGVGFEVHTTEIKEECAFNLDWTTNRVVKMVNPSKLNRFSGKPIGYKIMTAPTQLGLAHVDSMHNRRAEFMKNHFHITKYDDDELWGAGDHPWQSVGGRGGCRTWVARKQPLKGDPVVWFTLGFTHATRSEDWPLMPCEIFRMHFKPAGFFEVNPALDVPPSTQKVNKSAYANMNVPKNAASSDTNDAKCCGGKL